MARQLHRCASCGALVARAALTVSHPEGPGRSLWYCKDRLACSRRNQANVDALRAAP